MAEWTPERLSVVVPTYNRPAMLERVLRGLEGQTWPRERFEVTELAVEGVRQQLAAKEVAYHELRQLYEEQTRWAYDMQRRLAMQHERGCSGACSTDSWASVVSVTRPTSGRSGS